MERIYNMPIVVGSASIDVLGHVNNREYLRWMEEAATQHSAANGWDFPTLKAHGVAWVAREHWIEYLKPALVDQQLTMYTWVQSTKRFSSLRRYALKHGDNLLMVAATEWVFVDLLRQRPKAIIAPVMTAFHPVDSQDEVLKQLGIQRPVRYAPSVGL